MEHDRGQQDPVTPTRVIAARIRQERTKRGWSAERLAAEMTRVGVPWERSVVAKLETGRRASLSVDELLALAYALDVPPVYLLIPHGHERLAVTPELDMEPQRALRWISGESLPEPLPRGDREKSRQWAAVLGQLSHLRKFAEFYTRVAMLEGLGEEREREFLHELRQLGKLYDALNLGDLGAPPLPERWTERMHREGWMTEDGYVTGSPFIEIWNPDMPDSDEREEASLRDLGEVDRG